MTLLTMLTTFKSSTPKLSLVAREIGLVVAAASYQPVTAGHVPGVANVLTDKLSPVASARQLEQGD